MSFNPGNGIYNNSFSHGLPPHLFPYDGLHWRLHEQQHPPQ
jgi:hypothetical protein